jgi:hypothetical protein
MTFCSIVKSCYTTAPLAVPFLPGLFADGETLVATDVSRPDGFTLFDDVCYFEVYKETVVSI